MTDLAVQPLQIAHRRTTTWIRFAAVTLAVLALVALSFALGRATMDRGGSTTTNVRPAVVAPVNPPAGDAQPTCHVHVPC